jgi:hypothetical protein
MREERETFEALFIYSFSKLIDFGVLSSPIERPNN